MAPMPFGFALLRRFRPISGSAAPFATRYDDVHEVFATDAAFGVAYAENLKVITGGEDFFLGMGDTPRYRAQTAAMRKVVRPDDLPLFATKVEAQAEDRRWSGGRIESSTPWCAVSHSTFRRTSAFPRHRAAVSASGGRDCRISVHRVGHQRRVAH